MYALIIEDDPLIALLMADLLRELGFTSFAFAATEAEAVAAARVRCPDLITADVQLAAGSGVSAVRAICRDHPAPVIYVTGSPAELAEEPAAIVVAKPFTPGTLEPAVAAARRGLAILDGPSAGRCGRKQLLASPGVACLRAGEERGDPRRRL